MKIGVFSTFMSPTCTQEMVADFGRRAEQTGLESIWIGEHVVLFDNMEFPYRASKDGKVPVPPGGGLLDPTPVIGILGAVTKRLRFATGITLVPQRNPIYTAKEFATLDWLTNGRVSLGVGVGWCKEEVLACGYTWEDRGERCDEFLELIKALWTKPEVTYEGKHVQVSVARMDPKPVQKPHLPIIVGGHSKAGFRRAAKYGDGWYGFALDVDGARRALSMLDAALKEQGRSRAGFEISITPPGPVTSELVKAYADLGVDRVIAMLGNQKPENVTRQLGVFEALVRAV